jgi:DNA-binding transcriptional LysR family regulator
MAVQLRHLRYFARIVEAGSFSRAASVVHIAQPALSQQIAELEFDLGVPLLLRSARGVRPTAEGDILYREAISILGRMEQLPELVRASATEIEGVVNLGTTSTLATTLLGPMLEACRSALPKVTLRCFTAGGTPLTERLEAHTLHLACDFEDDPSSALARKPVYRQACYLVRNEPLPGCRCAISRCCRWCCLWRPTSFAAGSIEPSLPPAWHPTSRQRATRCRARSRLCRPASAAQFCRRATSPMCLAAAICSPRGSTRKSA